MKLTAPIRDLVTQIIARDVAAGVELARSIGHPMPKDFDVGVRFLDEGWAATRIRIRLNEVSHDVVVQLPHLDGRMSLTTVDAMWKTAWNLIHTDALVLAQLWLNSHPEARVSKEGAVKANAFLDAVTTDDVLRMKWMEACRDRAKHFTYR